LDALTRAAGLGAKVALVERHLMGGDCLNVGCVPSKGIIRSAHALRDVRRAAELGVRVPEGVAVDFGAVMARMRRVRSRISERDAAERGIEADTYMRRLDEVDRAVADGEAGGFVKVHVKKGTDRILGATIVARYAGEMIGEPSVAIANRIGLREIARAIHPYPTQAEAIRQVGDLYNRTRLTPRVKRLFAAWLRWRR